MRIVGHARIARKIGPSAEVGRTEEKKTRNETEARFLDLRISSTVLENREKTTLRSAKLKEQAGWLLREGRDKESEDENKEWSERQGEKRGIRES